MIKTPFLQELVEARMFCGAKDIKGMSAKEIAELIYLLIMLLEVVRWNKPSESSSYANKTMELSPYDSMYYSGTDLGNLLSVLNHQDAFAGQIKIDGKISLPLFQINRYLGAVRSNSNSGSEDQTFFWRLEDYLKVYGNSVFRQMRRDIGNWTKLNHADQSRIVQLLRKELDKRASSTDLYLWFKQNFKLKEDEEVPAKEAKEEIAEAVTEDAETDRLDITVHGDWSVRVFFEASLNSAKRTWVDIPREQDNGRIPRGSATVDLEPGANVAYINRIDAKPTGNGFGTELMQYIIQECTAHNFNVIKAYVEWHNIQSKDMFRKAGFKEVEKKSEGSHWELPL